MAGKFEIYKDKKGEFRFRLVAGNGEKVLASEGYKAKASCKNGIESVKKNCKDPKRFEKKKSKSGKFMFNLKAGNSQVIGTSQMYKSDSSCTSGIKSVKTTAPKAKIDDQC